MESSFSDTAQYVANVGMIVSAILVGLLLVAGAAVPIIAAWRNHAREDRPNDGSTGVPLEAVLPRALFAVPELDPFEPKSIQGEAHCWLCDEPTSVVGVLGRARAVGATLDSWVCKGRFGRIQHRVEQPTPLILVRGDLTDFEISADASKVLPFPDSALMVKQGLVS